MTDTAASTSTSSPGALSATSKSVRERLHQLIAVGHYGAAAQLVENQFIEVWYGMPPTELRQVIETIPGWLRARHVVTDYLFELLGGKQAEGRDRLLGDDSRAAAYRPATDTEPLLGAIEVLKLRLRGELAAAMTALKRTQRRLHRENSLVDSTRGWNLFASVQAGNTALLAGSLELARASFTRAQLMPSPGGLEFLQRDSCIKLALLEALFGDASQATEERLLPKQTARVRFPSSAPLRGPRAKRPGLGWTNAR